jgi:hypothetical protein
MLNSSLEFVDKKTRVQRNLRSILDENPVVQESEPVIPQQEEETLIEEPAPVVEERRGFMVPENEASVIPQLSDEELKPINSTNDKLRVVEVIPINDTVTEKEEEKDFMVNDFQDDDYVDFESAIKQVEEN